MYEKYFISFIVFKIYCWDNFIYGIVVLFNLQVGYEAGSEGTRLPPIYMNSLDNELIQVLHKAAQYSHDTNTVLELIFHVLDD